MIKFLKLSFVIINILNIKQIIIQEDNYCVHLNDNYIKGGYSNFFKNGDIISDNSKIIICKNKNPKDYEIITNWINNL